MNKFLKVLVAAFMVMSLAACSKGTTEETPNNDATDYAALAQGKTVTIWHTFTNAQLETLEAIAAEFNANNEYGITVNVESQTYDGFLDTVKTNVYNGTGPDMILNYASAAADYVADELVVDFAPYIADATVGIQGYASSKPAGVIEEESGFEDGKQHIIVTQQTGPIYFYNKTVFDSLGLQAPTTWAEVESNAKTIFEQTGKIGFALDSITDVAQTLIKQAGNDYIDVAGKKITFNDAETIKSINFIGDGCKDGYFSIKATNSYFSEDMTAGLVASYIGSVAGLPYVAGKGVFESEQELAVAPLPLEGSKWTPAWDRGMIAFDYEDEGRAVASYLFIKYFTETENSLRWNMAMNSLSPYFAVQENADYQSYLADNTALKALSQQTEFAGVLPSVTGSATVRNELADAVKAVAAGEATAEEALTECEENSNAALSE